MYTDMYIAIYISISMGENHSMQEKLLAFRNLNKFSDSAWEKRGLNPSDADMCSFMENSFNECADDLIEAAKLNFKSGQFKNILQKGLSCFNAFNYDTEEREFICDYFVQLSVIVAVDFNENLNKWLYGRILNTLYKVHSFFKGRDKFVETLTQYCTSCGSALETFILRKEDGIPDYNWTVIKCNACNEYNLLSVGPNVKELKFGNYTSIEDISKSDFTEEQANTRLEQIKFFRKKW